MPDARRPDPAAGVADVGVRLAPHRRASAARPPVLAQGGKPMASRCSRTCSTTRRCPTWRRATRPFASEVLRRSSRARVGLRDRARAHGEDLQRKLRIYEIPIAYYGRSYEEGKKITWRDGFGRVSADFSAPLRGTVVESTIARSQSIFEPAFASLVASARPPTNVGPTNSPTCRAHHRRQRACRIGTAASGGAELQGAFSGSSSGSANPASASGAPAAATTKQPPRPPACRPQQRPDRNGERPVEDGRRHRHAGMPGPETHRGVAGRARKIELQVSTTSFDDEGSAPDEPDREQRPLERNRRAAWTGFGRPARCRSTPSMALWPREHRDGGADRLATCSRLRASPAATAPASTRSNRARGSGIKRCTVPRSMLAACALKPTSSTREVRR